MFIRSKILNLMFKVTVLSFRVDAYFDESFEKIFRIYKIVIIEKKYGCKIGIFVPRIS